MYGSRNLPDGMDMMNDSIFLDRKIINDCGINSAVVYWYISIQKEGIRQDGHYWIKMSLNDASKLIPFLSSAQIRSALKRLEDSGLILTGYYNEHKMQRTKWYAIPEAEL